jgi:RNA ligase (TIGR02306 family)
MSTHRVEVVRLGPIEKHPNADTLGIVRVWGYTAIVRLGDYAEGDLVAYIEPDYVVPETEAFAFLGGHRRIKARRLRGVWSQGLVISAPEGAVEGDDVMESLGIVRYEPPTSGRPGTHGVKGPPIGVEAPHPTLAHLPKYDLENLRRYPDVFEPGEMVYASEKVHGANARFAWRDGRMWAGSRTHWRQLDLESWWTAALAEHGWIEDWCREHEDAVLYGEVFGFQDLRYGVKPGAVHFLVFDAMRSDFTFATPAELAESFDARFRVPGSFVEYDLARLEEMSRQDSVVCPGQVSEGIVVKPLAERFDRRVGRVALKLVSDRYLERAK